MKEKLNILKNEADALNTDFTELTDEDISQVSGGANTFKVFPYVVKEGESLSVIAARFHTTIDLLCELNHFENPKVIHAGEHLCIPLVI